MTRKELEACAWKSTHPDFKGSSWHDNLGQKHRLTGSDRTILVGNPRGGSMLVTLGMLSDAQLMEMCSPKHRKA